MNPKAISLLVVVLLSGFVAQIGSATNDQLEVVEYNNYPTFCTYPPDYSYPCGTYGSCVSVCTQFYSRVGGDTQIKVNTWYAVDHESGNLSVGSWTSTYSPGGVDVKIYAVRILNGEGAQGTLRVHWYGN